MKVLFCRVLKNCTNKQIVYSTMQRNTPRITLNHRKNAAANVFNDFYELEEKVHDDIVECFSDSGYLFG